MMKKIVVFLLGIFCVSNVEGQVTISPEYLAKMEDSLRFQWVGAAKQKFFLRNIIQYYDQANGYTGLEQYVSTLPNCNRSAFYTFCMFLIQQYTLQGEATQAEAWKQAALAPDPNDKDINSRIKWFEYGQSRKLASLDYQQKKGLTSADSAALLYIATASTSLSEAACLQAMAYRLYLPCQIKNTYTSPSVNCNASGYQARRGDEEVNLKSENNNQGTVANNASSAVFLGNPVPNPATRSTTIQYNILNQNNAQLKIHEMSTGRIIDVIQLEQSTGAVSINLEGYKSGVYAYSLLVGGNNAKTKRLIVVK